MRANHIHHLQAFHMRMQHGKHILLSFLWQGNAGWSERNVLETIICNAPQIHNQIMHVRNRIIASRITDNNRHNILGQDFISNSRGNLDRN